MSIKHIKGYGIKSIANNHAWHHRVPTTQELRIFKSELKIWEKYFLKQFIS